MKIFFLVISILIFSLGNLNAQENIPVGNWRSHFNYEQTSLIEVVGASIYCAAQHGLVYYDTEDNSINLLSKINGLSDIEVSALSYDTSSEVLLLGYDNGNIDIINGDQITNITTIKDADLQESKRINHILLQSGLAYLSTNFGVLVLDPNDGAILEAYQNLGSQGEAVVVKSATLLDNNIFLATDIGVLRGDLGSGANLQDFNNWDRFDQSVVQGISFNSIVSSQGSIFASDENELFVYSNNSWNNSNFQLDEGEVLKLREQNNQLYVLTTNSIYKMESADDFIELVIEGQNEPRDIVQFDNGQLWFADASNGMSRLDGTNPLRFVPSGPSTAITGRLQYQNGIILALPVSIGSTYEPENNSTGYSEFSQGAWSRINSEDISGLMNVTGISEDANFISSFGDGILNVSDQEIYDETNSPLELTDTDVLVSGLAQDNEATLWIANSGSQPLIKRSPNGSWNGFGFGLSITERPQNLKVDNLGQIWMWLSNTTSGGLIAFNPENEDFRLFRATDGLPSSRINDVEFALDEEVWIATTRGIAFLPFTFGVIEDNSIDAIQPVFENRFLFDDEIISAIEIDGGNRKWIGTDDGLWLFEDNADELITNFNEENSPLPSNNILDLKIHPETGELFIATDKGLVSFRTDATQGNAFHEQVKIFPNPVLPGYNGLVGISGLASDVNVKITSVSGRLVKELFAAGGSTSWDVADFNGVRATSGVYLVFSSSSDGKETFVGKIAVIN